MQYKVQITFLLLLITYQEVMSQHQLQKIYGSGTSITNIFDLEHSPGRTTILFRPGSCFDINNNYGCLNVGFLSFDNIDNPINSVVLHSPNYDTSFFISDFLELPNRNIISVGNIFTINNSFNSACILNVDSSFSFLRGVTLSLNDILFYHLKRDNSVGSYLISGNYDSSSTTTNEILLCKIDTSFIPQWTKKYSTQNVVSMSDFDLMPNGYISICGYTRDTSSTFQKILLLMLDSSGNVVWSKNYSTQKHANAHAVKAKSNGIVISGFAYDSIYNQQCPFLMKLDTSGNIIWFKKYVCQVDLFVGMISTSDGGFLMSSRYAYGGGADCLIKTDSLGNVQWNYYYINGRNNQYHCEADDHGYFSLGERRFYIPIPPDSIYIYLIKTDSSGSTGCDESTFPIIISTDNNFTVNNQTIIESNYTPTVDSFLLVKDTLPLNEIILCDTYTGIKTIEPDILNFSIYPNPAGRTIFVTIDSNISTSAKIDITNILGEKIILTKKDILYGNNIFNFDVSKYSNGIYFATVETKIGIKRIKFIKQGE